MPDDSYWEDCLIWSEQQSALLQRLANGEPVNAEIDWDHVIEEVRDLGSSELRVVETLLRRSLQHLLRAYGWPRAPTANHWQVEALKCLLDAQAACSPSMRARVDLPDAYRCALMVFRELARGETAPFGTPPDSIPFSLIELLPIGDATPDIDALLAKFDA